MSATARARFAPSEIARAGLAPLWIILGTGFVLRLLFIGSTGFHNDVQAFESWTGTLSQYAPWNFYARAGFADYPPGYFVVLWFLGKLYALIPGASGDPMHGWIVLRVLVKLPAIAMDLVDAGVIYLIVRRYAAQSVALVAAAMMALNPAAIYVSSYWGQVDSVSWGLVLIAIWLVLQAGDEPAKTPQRLTWAWLALTFSVLIKPQGATIALLFLVYPFACDDPQVRTRRLIGTALGIVASAALALAVALLFHPAPDVIGWLFQRYLFGSNVYQYTSVNAFNLYALRLPFWTPDAQTIWLFGIPAGTFAIWGIALVGAATVLIVGRYLQRRDERAFLEAAMLCALAFFILATRMHERYVYGAFLLAMPLIAFGRRGIWPSVVLTVTMYINLAYSLAYQTVMESHLAGVNAQDLWPGLSHPASLANVVLFFWLGYLYLGTEVAAGPDAGAGAAARPTVWSNVLAALGRARAWFDPREGTVAMTRTDWFFAGGFVFVAFAIAVVSLGWPPEKIFDEVYFPRSAVEYLKHVPQYEWTHPPFVKLFIAASVALLGDNSFGWRFFNVVIGALEVGVIYAFAKRLLGSTLFAAVAALLMTFDGFHFVEQRIATGEITIATFLIFALYALYRYLLNTQVAVAVRVRSEWTLVAIGMAVAVPLAAGFSWPANIQPPVHPPKEMIANGIYNTAGADFESYAVAFVYALIGLYIAVRLLTKRFGAVAATITSYADGAYVRAVPGEKRPATFVPPTVEDGVRRKVQPDGRYEYATPEGSARFTPDGTMTAGDATVAASTSWVWLGALVVALGLSLSSKWNGFYDLGLVFCVFAAVTLQRFFPRGALFGNPRGFALDISIALAVFAPATIYALSYIPTFLLGSGHSLADIMALQHQMYWYHSNLADHTHPYRSLWWQWPIEQIPISYYYKDFRAGADAANRTACCVAEILALPNPAVFLLGLISVPFTGWLAWRDKHKGYALLVLAYLFQWVPWIFSPREMFEYHFFPNLAIIVLCDAVLVAYVWRRLAARSFETARWSLGAYAAIVVALFVFFYPVLAGTKVAYSAWYQRMWPDELGIPYTSWIIPNRN